MPIDTYFEAETLDDLLQVVLPKLLVGQDYISTSRGNITELFGATLVLHNPRARLSRSESKGKIFSALGELLWYLSGENKLSFIKYYVGEHYSNESEDGITVRSGYGERLFHYNNTDQIANIIDLLKEKPSSRRAVIQLFDASDLVRHYVSIPCTCTLQFVIRDNLLNVLVNMRSNDAYLGLPHDVFAFTMLQEIIARSIGIDVGIYQHCAGSLHLYEMHRPKAQTYLGEGWQNPIKMNPMPPGNPWEAIKAIQSIEQLIKEKKLTGLDEVNLGSYWKDICTLLLIYRYWKDKDYKACEKLKGTLNDRTYEMFVDDKFPV
ncbi:thymidylate synthase [Chitinivorax sp. B]|uniref:thymidylate synthase n=1 Tax=Chitinivorax sp. B TaxID=2502235 RepID=UPI0010F52BF5|nr:thymidylate synthase [Chitinivorax sp. B]